MRRDKVEVITSSVIKQDSDLRTVYEIAEERQGTRPSPCTVWRWTHEGVRGVRLEAVRSGAKWMTSREAFAEFLKLQTLQSQQDSVVFQRQSEPVPRRSAGTEADLRRHGLVPAN